MRNTTVPTSPAMPVPKELIAFPLYLSHSGCIAFRMQPSPNPRCLLPTSEMAIFDRAGRGAQSHRNHIGIIADVF